MEDNIKKLFEKNNNNKSKFREVVEARNQQILDDENFQPVEDKFIDSQTELDEKGRPKILRNVIAQRLEDYTISLQEEHDDSEEDEFANLTKEEIKKRIDETLKKHKFTWTYDDRKFMDQFYLNKKESKSVDVRKRKRMYEKALINQNKMPDFLTIHDPLDQVPVHFLRKSSYMDPKTGEIKEALYKDTSRGRKDFIRWLILNDLYDKYKNTLNHIPGESNDEIYQNELNREKVHEEFLTNHFKSNDETQIPTFNTRIDLPEEKKEERVQFDYSKRPYSFEHNKYQPKDLKNRLKIRVDDDLEEKPVEKPRPSSIEIARNIKKATQAHDARRIKSFYDSNVIAKKQERDYDIDLSNEVFKKLPKQQALVKKNRFEVNKDPLKNNSDIVELKKQILALRKELIDIKSTNNQQKNSFKDLKNKLQDEIVKATINSVIQAKQDVISQIKETTKETKSESTKKINQQTSKLDNQQEFEQVNQNVDKQFNQENKKDHKKDLPAFFDFDIDCVDEFVKSSADKMLQAVNVPIMQTLSTKVNVNELLKAQQSLQTKNIRVSTIALISKAISIALLKHKKFNGTYDFKNCLISLIQSHNIGLVIQTDDGQIKIPVIKEVANKTAKVITQNLDQIKHLVKTNNIVPKDNYSFTVTNTGSQQNDIKPILYSTNLFAIGFAKPIKKENGTKQNRSVLVEMPLSITYDARCFSNREANQFLTEIKNLLENPEILTIA